MELDGFHDVGIVWLGQFDAGEEVGSDATEERQVVGEELGEIHILDGAQHENLFILFRVLQLQVSGRSEH